MLYMLQNSSQILVCTMNVESLPKFFKNRETVELSNVLIEDLI